MKVYTIMQMNHGDFGFEYYKPYEVYSDRDLAEARCKELCAASGGQSSMAIQTSTLIELNDPRYYVSVWDVKS